MNLRFFPIFLTSLLVSTSLFAKGREPGENKGFGWDDSRVRRGSPANPNSSYKPPQFEGYSAAPSRPEETEPNPAPAARKKKSSEKAVEAYSTEEPAHSLPPSPPPTVTPPSTTLESGEQALPENDPPEKPQPPTKIP